jgi:hypothetical protein
MTKLWLIGMQLPEKYKENFERRLVGKLVKSRQRAFARNVEVLLVFFWVVASLSTKIL